MNTKFMTGEIVTLVTIPEYLPVLQIPHTGEYENPYIVKISPCNKRGNKYFDLRSGKEIFKKKSTLEWLNLSGTVFRYEDGLNILVSKKFNSNITLGLPIAANEINHRMMITRNVFDHSKKNDA